MMLRDRVEAIELNLRQIIKTVIEDMSEWLKKKRFRRLRGCGFIETRLILDVVGAAKTQNGLEKGQQIGGPLAGALSEVALAQRVERDSGVHQSVAQVAQRLPESGAAARSLLDPGERLGPGLSGANHLTERFFQEEVFIHDRNEGALGLDEQFQRELIKCQYLQVKKRQLMLARQQNLKAAPQRVRRHHDQ
jgi:hypothetical protein